MIMGSKLKWVVVEPTADVDDVKADIASNKLTVVGKKVDPAKVKEKVEEKTKNKVEIVSVHPKKEAAAPAPAAGGGDKKAADGKPEKKPDEKPKEVPLQPSASYMFLTTVDMGPTYLSRSHAKLYFLLENIVSATETPHVGASRH